jgi:hypothetical protein
VRLGCAKSSEVMYEKSSSVTWGGYARLPKGDSLAPCPPQNERPQPLIETAAAVVRSKRMLPATVGGTLSRCVYLAADSR